MSTPSGASEGTVAGRSNGAAAPIGEAGSSDARGRRLVSETCSDQLRRRSAETVGLWQTIAFHGRVSDRLV